MAKLLKGEELKEELSDNGLLQEVNRRYFHPLGLALGYTVDDDPEGMIFAEPPSAELRDRVKFRRNWRFAGRRQSLGYDIQPCDDGKS